MGNEEIEQGARTVTVEIVEEGNEEMTLSVHALKSSQGTDTIKVQASYRNRQHSCTPAPFQL